MGEAWATTAGAIAKKRQDPERDVAGAERTWARALTLLTDQNLSMMILDELNVALRYGYVSLEAVLEGLRARPPEGLEF